MSPKSVLTGVYIGGVVLTNTYYTNPVTVAGSGFLRYGIVSYSPWRIVNDGTIWAIRLHGGSVSNAAAGYIKGANFVDVAGSVDNAGTLTGGVYLGAGGSVTNEAGGVISSGEGGSSVEISRAAGAISNAGTISTGIVLFAGGNVSNTTGGAIYGGYIAPAVAIYGGAGTVDNTGRIDGGADVGVALNDGGSVMNDATSVIEGATAIAIGLTAGTAGGAGTVANAGTIAGGIALYLGSVNNAAGGVIQGNSHGGSGVIIRNGIGTVTNVGSITGGVGLAAGGSVSNASGGVIQGQTGNPLPLPAVLISGGAGSVNNDGSIYGVALQAGVITNAAGGHIQGVAAVATKFNPVVTTDTAGGAGTIANAGSITGGVLLGLGGSVSNAAGGVIKGGVDATGHSLNPFQTIGGPAVVSNEGGISGDDGVALYLGSVDNAVGGVIEGSVVGIGIAGAGSVANAGSIAGGTGDGIALHDGGGVSNAAMGVIQGGTTAVGVFIEDRAGTLTNAGSITGGADGVALYVGNVDNVAGGAIAGGSVGIDIAGGGSVTNSGSIGGGTGDGIALHDGGSVDNSGRIQGGAAAAGVYIGERAGTVTNTGRITGGAHGIALYLGSVANAAGGVIESGGVGIAIAGGGGITNAGTVSNTSTSQAAIVLSKGGSIINSAGGVIVSPYRAIYIDEGGTVTNAGTIAATGAGATGVELHAGAANRMIVDPGAQFAGVVDGGNAVGSGIVSVLELAAGSGMLAGIGTSFANFGSIVFDPAAAWKIAGSTAGLAGGEVISGFAAGDTIELAGVIETISDFDAGTLTLTGSATLEVRLPGSFTRSEFVASPVAGGTDITVACFRAGTRILAEAGEIEVERLQVGMRAVSLLHRTLSPIAWIGHRRLREAWPVRVCAGAFAGGLPHRDLWLSPDHAVFVDEVLVPVRYLINGATIVQEHRCEVCYFHVELAEHDVLLADGLPVESYLDTGNRAAFANGGTAVRMNPDFAFGVWQRQACTKLVTDGPAVVAVQERLLARAEQLGWSTTAAPAPLLLADGRRFTPHASGDETVTFHLPPGCRDASLQSRATIPAHLDPSSTDHRRLGLAVAALALDGTPLPLDDARLGAGWHAPEPGLRWTDGAARIALAGERTISVRYHRLLSYWDRRAKQVAAVT